MPRVKVFYTVDVETWPGGWTNLDARFPEAFKHYIYGDTPQGQYALPLTLQILRDHDLKAVFFVEPLFSARFGVELLQEVVGLIDEAGQEIQMHLHAEWVNEARVPLLSWRPVEKIQHLSHFSLEDQTDLIAWARKRLFDAGVASLSAFRAGSFAFNRDTLKALEANGLYNDSSYNHCCGGAASGIRVDGREGEVPVQPFQVGNVLEFPVTIYRDFPSHLRPLQLTACSLAEMISVLRKAADEEHSAVVIVSHNFELLDRRDFSCDEIVARRFRGLCEFLSSNTDRFETCGFGDGGCEPWPRQPMPVKGDMLGLGVRYIEQARRRL